MNRKTRSSILLTVCIFIVFCLILGYGAGVVIGKTPFKGKEGSKCLSCHPELKKELEAGKSHQPLKSEECMPCHSPHAARYEYLLLEVGDRLCYGCHESNKRWLKDKAVHLPVEYGECLKCHQPHVSSFDNLLRLEGKDLCCQCHDNSSLQKEYVHQPVKEGRCKACHQSHSSANSFLLTQSSPQLCWPCHPVNQKLISKHARFQINQADCLQCHDPHSSDRENLIHSILHEPYAQNKCEDCHPESSGSMKPASGNAKTCYKCHKDSKEKYDAKKKSHVVSGPRECIFCHNPHGSEREDLVRRGDRSLCTACHQDMGRKLKGVAKGLRRHPEVLAGKCSTCHDAHASDEVKFLQNSPVILCVTCHARHKVSCHPVGEKALDPRDGTPIDCITCHNPMEAEFPQIMRLDGKKELCNQCHKY